MARGGRTGSVIPNTPPTVVIDEADNEPLFTDNSNNIIVDSNNNQVNTVITPDKGEEVKDNLYIDETDEDNFFDDFFYDE